MTQGLGSYMSNDKSKWAPKEMGDVAIDVSYILLGLAAMLFLGDLLISILGSKLLPMRLIRDVSFAGDGLLIRYIGRRYQKGIRMKKKEYVLFAGYNVFCMCLFIPLPYNILFSILVIIGSFIIYKAQFKSSVQN